MHKRISSFVIWDPSMLNQMYLHYAFICTLMHMHMHIHAYKYLYTLIWQLVMIDSCLRILASSLWWSSSSFPPYYPCPSYIIHHFMRTYHLMWSHHCFTTMNMQVYHCFIKYKNIIAHALWLFQYHFKHCSYISLNKYYR